jgi:hypothetical protein
VAYSFASSASLVWVRLHQGYAAFFISSIHDFRQYLLDLFHVLERLWTAAHCFHREGSEEAERFVEDRLRGLLEGRVGYVIGGLRQRLTKHGLTGSLRKTLESVIT